VGARILKEDDVAIRTRLSSLFRNLLRRRKVDQDLDDEIQSTFDLLVDEQRNAGASPVAARREAALQLGGIEPLKEAIRGARAGSVVDEIARDVRYAARMLVKSPGFLATAVMTLAIGVGLNTTVFGFVYALLKPLPVEDLSSLVTVYMTDERNPGERGVSRQNYVDFAERNDVFDNLTAEGFSSVNLSGSEGEPQRVDASVVAGNYFATMGVKPLLGRSFTPAEDRTEGAELVTVLAHALWQERFSGDPGIVGRTITLNNSAFTVLGVMPPGFRGIEPIAGPDLWVPIMTYPITTTGQTRQGLASRRFDWFALTGRLKPGVTRSQAEANLKTIARQLEQAYPNDNGGRSVGVRRLNVFDPGMQRHLFTSIGMLMTIVGLILFIACTNVANLMLARAAARQKELAIRQALGASRARLLRQLLTEGLLLSIVGGAAGLLVARSAQRILWSYRPPTLGPSDVDLALNLQVLVFTALVSLVTCVLFALVPALRASRPDVVAELKGQTSRVPGSGRRVNFQDALMSSQVALSLVALVVAGLFIRSLQTVERVDPGLDVAALGVMRFDLGAQGYAEPQGREFQRQVLERVSTVGGVDSAALADFVPLSGGAITRTVFIEGEDLTDRRNGRIMPTAIVGAGFFAALGTPVGRGRAFTDEDRATASPVAIVNERLASQLWPGQEALGKRVKLFNTGFYEVVGVVGNMPSYSLGDDLSPILYRPLTQVYQSNLALIVRANDPGAAIGAIRQQIQALDPRLPITGASTLSDVVYGTLWTPRMAAWLLTLLGLVSLMLAAMGIYGVMAYSVSQRTRELGIRVVLGAHPAALVRLVVGQGLRLALMGIVLGLVAALAATRLLAGLLYGSPTDPMTFAVVPAILALAVLAASYLPARRATRIPPTTALRSDA
jgi:predicted permease